MTLLWKIQERKSGWPWRESNATGCFKVLLPRIIFSLFLLNIFCFRQFIDNLPAANRECMKRLLEFLCLIHYNSSFNGSTMDELCDKFASALIRCERGDEDPQVEKDKKVVKSIVEFMIKRFPLIYPEEGDCA
jgi:hypothetical protein